MQASALGMCYKEDIPAKEQPQLIAIVSMLIDHMGSAFFHRFRFSAGLAAWIFLLFPTA